MSEIIVVHGYAGAGKTTHCERAAREGLGSIVVKHISVGNILREIRANIRMSEFSAVINSPEAISPLPDETVRGVILEAINQHPDESLFLSDGFPRYAHAVEGFQGAIQDSGHTLVGAVHLDISLPKSIERVLARGARYDEPESAEIQESFAAFRYNRDKQTTNIALLELSRIAPVETIDASGDLEEVYSRFACALGRLVLANSQDTTPND